MSNYQIIDEAIKNHNSHKLNTTLTIGLVVDTNDPQQMGRIRVHCSAYGDREEDKINDLPWAQYISPFAGTMNTGLKGATQEQTKAPTAYGFWNVPKVGAQVLVGCVDGNTALRFWIGCLQPQYLPNTMPHGRYINRDNHDLEYKGAPIGPLDTDDNPIEPLFANFTQHFTSDDSLVSGTPSEPRKNMEWRTRGADTQVAAINNAIIRRLEKPSEIQSQDFTVDDLQTNTIEQEDGTTFTMPGPGYTFNQITPDFGASEKTGGFNLDSTTYSWTTPGFHSISMDDRAWNCRMRFRTTSGNQIILDDTNERIYVSSAKGNTWIEVDQVGNVDMYADKNVSVRAGGDINYTTDQTFRVKAKEGIHLHTEGEYRVRAEKQIHFNTLSTLNITTQDNINVLSNSGIDIETSDDTNIKSGSGLSIETANDVNINSGSNVNIQTGSSLHIDTSADTLINSSGDIIGQGSMVYFHGPGGGPDPGTLSLSSLPTVDESSHAYWTSRVPEHEPWARVFMTKQADKDKDNKWEPEFSYTSTQVGKGSPERGETYDRNELWRR